MKRNIKKNIEEAISKELPSRTCQNLIFKDVIFNSFFRFLFILLFLIYSILERDKLIKVFRLTLDTILNHEGNIDAGVYYFSWIIVLLSLLFISLLLAIIFSKVIKKIYLKKIYFFYKIYDILIFIASIIVIINFIIMYIITPVTIEGRSMESSYSNGDKVLLWHFAYEPQTDDVVVIDASNYGGSDSFYVKRIVASPGQNLVYSNGYLYVDGIVVENSLTESEWYIITNTTTSSFISSYVVPEDKYLLLGDNRRQSTDSRYFGLVDKSDIIGKIILRYYPFSRFGIPNKIVKE